MSNTTNPHPSKNTREDILVLPAVAHTSETFPFTKASMDAKAIYSRYHSILSIISEDEPDDEKANTLYDRARKESTLFWKKAYNFKNREEAEDLKIKYRTLFEQLYEQWQNKQINIDELLQSSELCPLSAEKVSRNI